jgi:hypothetical protein
MEVNSASSSFYSLQDCLRFITPVNLIHKPEVFVSFIVPLFTSLCQEILLFRILQHLNPSLDPVRSFVEGTLFVFC